MNKSDSIGALALALSKAMGEIENLAKDKSGYGYKYVELGSILEEVRPLLAKNELAAPQLCITPISENTECVGIETVLMHSSGEWISSTYYMKITAGKGMSGAQAAGSVITYARRYALAALLGIAQVDDDAVVSKEAVVPKDNSKWEELYSALLALIFDHDLHANTEKWLQHYKVKDLQQLNETQISKLIQTIKENVNG